jgi:hypothetical protein
MTPKLENEAQYMRLERRKEPCNTTLLTRKQGYVAVRVVTDGHTERLP